MNSLPHAVLYRKYSEKSIPLNYTTLYVIQALLQ